MGYRLEVENMVFAGLIAAVSTGKCDVAAGNITVTEERAKSVIFTDPVVTIPTVVMVRDDSAPSAAGFIDYFRDGVYSTFIEDGRYRLMLSGVGATVALTAVSALAGTALGVLFFFMKRSRLRALRMLAGLVDRLTGGLPAVVVLLVLAYIVFGSVPIGGFWVAAVAFSVIFGAGFSETLAVGTASVGHGQTEAALAMGLKRGEAFRLVVFPQALRTMARLYSAQMADLLKGTAIVGYIAVDDLTRASDIVRSVTFDAFFPLVSTALVYLLIIWLMTAALRAVERAFSPGPARRARARKRIAPLL
jgi:polar amino acid transport system substrate-binding protein